jgi:hypothetical protein
VHRIMSHSFLQDVLWIVSRTPPAGRIYSATVATKYYTHFVTHEAPRNQESSSEWSGVVELRHPLEGKSGPRELRALLAQSFDLDSDEIKILHWARLH